LRADARRRLGLADDEVVLLHFGWYPHRKGNDVLADAVRLLNERGLGPLVALSVGAPSAAPPLRALPFTDHVLELHQAADIFVSASRSEAFGNGVVEALACGNVAVATLASGQREIFEGLEGCWTARPGDPESLARAIAACLERRDDWPRLGAANRRHVVDNYGMRSWAARMVSTYADLCDSDGRACA
jgi:glycosyltransferase involved in cell wall biosynthesis